MKKQSFAATLLAVAAFFTPNTVFALSGSNNDLSIEIARMNMTNNLIDRINLLYQTAEKYILQTGDTNPTIDKIESLYKIDKNTWLNYDKSGYMNLSVVQSNSKNAIIIKNPVSPSEVNIANYISNSRKLDALGIVKIIKQKQADGTEKIVEIDIEFPFSPTLVTFIKAIKNDIPNQYPNGKISYMPPSSDSNTKTWLKPDGNGSFVVYQQDRAGKWNMKGVYSPNTGFTAIDESVKIIPQTTNKVKPLIRVEDISQLQNKILPEGSLATDIQGDMYVTDGQGNWYLLGKNKSGN